MRSPSGITSPRLRPRRNCIRRGSGRAEFLALSSRWMATAHCTASSTLANSASRLSPGGVHDATTILLDKGGDGVTVDRHGADGGLFILAHQAAISCDIGT